MEPCIQHANATSRLCKHEVLPDGQKREPFLHRRTAFIVGFTKGAWEISVARVHLSIKTSKSN